MDQQEKLSRIRAKLSEITGRSPVKVTDDGFLVPSWSPPASSALGRDYARDPEYRKRSQHNYAVFELWEKVPCSRCGGPSTSGWGVLPDLMKELLDPSKPPKLCYGCWSKDKLPAAPVSPEFDGIG